MRENRLSGGVGGCRGAIPGTRPERTLRSAALACSPAFRLLSGATAAIVFGKNRLKPALRTLRSAAHACSPAFRLLSRATAAIVFGKNRLKPALTPPRSGGSDTNAPRLLVHPPRRATQPRGPARRRAGFSVSETDAARRATTARRERQTARWRRPFPRSRSGDLPGSETG